MRPEEARLHVLEEMLHGEERLRLARAEPQARQLVLGRVRLLLLEAIAALVAVPHDGSVVAAPHVLDVALEGGKRDFELAEEVLHRDHAALPDEVVDFVEPFGAVHPELGTRLRGCDSRGRGDASRVHRAFPCGVGNSTLSPWKLARGPTRLGS